MQVINAINENFKEIKNDSIRFVEFLKKNRGVSIVTAFFLILCYGIKLFYYSISIDTEVIINDSYGLCASWLSIQRFGFVLTKKIFGFLDFNPYVATFLMICSIFIFSMLWAFIFNYFSFDKDKKKIWLSAFTILFLSTPLFAEQFNFLLQGFEAAFAIILCSIAIFSITKWVLNKSNIVYLIIGIICMVWCFGSYQALVQLYISAALAIYILIYVAYSKNKVELEKNFFRWAILKYSITFLIGYGIFRLISKIIMDFLYPGQEYLSGQILWGKAPASQCINNIINYMKDTMLGEGTFYNKWFIIIAVMLIAYAIMNLFSKRQDKVLLLLAMIVFVISPYLLSMYVGTALVPRSQFALQFVAAFGTYFIIDTVNSRKVKMISMIVVLLVGLHQSYICANLFYTDYMKYQGERELALKISMKIDDLNLGASPEYPVVFIGSYHPNTNSNEVDGDVIGKSFFEWDAPNRSNFRIHGFLKTIGYSYVSPTDEQVEKGRQIAEGMTAWPSSTSVKLQDGIIVVKLS